MSTIWTPGGERPVPPPGREQPAPPASAPPGHGEPSEAELDALREQLARTPAAVIVANHCMGLFELAALHMSLSPPQLSEAQVAIDSMAAIVEGLPGRFGEAETQLKEALAQLRFAFVQLRSAHAGSGPETQAPPEAG